MQLKNIRLQKYSAAVFTAVAGLVLLYVFLPPAAVWITDNGNKYIIARNFTETGSVAIEHPCKELFPCGGFHFVRMADGSIRSFHSEVFPVLTSFIRRLAGDTAMALPALAATVILLILMGRYCRRSHPGWGLVLASPFLFYSLLLWEMTPSALFAFAAFYGLWRKKFLVTGIMLGIGIYFREELYMLALAVGITLLICREYRGLFKCIAASAVTVLPLWVINWFSSGHILGIHGANYALNARDTEAFSLIGELKGVVFNFYQHIIRFETLSKGVSDILAATGCGALIVAGCSKKFRDWKVLKLTAFGIYAVCCAVLVWGLYRSESPLYSAGMTMGLVISLPLAAGFFLNFRALCSSPAYPVALAAKISLIYIIIVPPLLTRFDIGLTWGARHFMILMPVLTILSIHALHRMRLGRRMFLTVLTISVLLGGAMQLWAVRQLVKSAEMTAGFETVISELPQKVVVTDLFYLPEETPRLFFNKTVLEAVSAKQTEQLFDYLQKAQINEFILILSKDSNFRRLNNDGLRRIMQKYPVTAPIQQLSVAPQLEVFVAICRKR